jgi:outer membrane protein TolC
MIMHTVLALLAAAFFAGSAFGLTMEGAVSLALENNHRIKQFERQESASREDVGAARSGFFPSLDLMYSYTESTEEIFFGAWQYTVSTSYNLFDGFSDLNGLRAARAEARASLYRKRGVMADTVLSVKTAYAEVLRARRLEETARESVELLERQVRDSELFFREGLIARNELLEVQVELASARQELLQAEGNRRVALKRLERAMGAEVPEGEEITDLSEAPDGVEETFEALSEEMLGQRSELNFLRLRRDARRHEMKALKGGYLPEVDLTVSYDVREESTLTRISDTENEELRGVVTARWNLFDGFGTTHRKKSAMYLTRAAEQELRDTEEELLFQLREALEDYRISKGKLEVARTAVSQAEENYRVTESRFRERVATGTDLLDARNFLTRARNQYFNALYDIHIAVARIERVVEREAVRGE